MAATRYKLETGLSVFGTAGAKTLGSSFFGTPTAGTPAGPTGLATSIIVTNVAGGLIGSLPDSDYGNLNDVFLDVFFYKIVGAPLRLCSMAVEYWGWAVSNWSVTASGGVGEGDGSSYATLDAGNRTADGVVADNQWHRARFSFPAGSVAGTLMLFLGSNRFGVTPTASITLPNFLDPGTFNGQRVSFSYFSQPAGYTTRINDAAYGVITTDAVPVRSATDWAVPKSFVGMVPM